MEYKIPKIVLERSGLYPSMEYKKHVSDKCMRNLLSMATIAEFTKYNSVNIYLLYLGERKFLSVRFRPKYQEEFEKYKIMSEMIKKMRK